MDLLIFNGKRHSLVMNTIRINGSPITPLIVIHILSIYKRLEDGY
jgi:hypothetical protein